MLEELENTSQIPDERLRRWFSDSHLDLIVWEEDNGKVLGFQLCYGKGIDEHALTWRKSDGYTHDKVDDGEDPGMDHKSSPILVSDGQINPSALAEGFLARSTNIDSTIAELVYEKLLDCGK